MKCLAALSVAWLVSGCVVSSPGSPDARPLANDDTDARNILPGFRDAGGCGSGPSGTGSSGTSGTIPGPGPSGTSGTDCGEPDATPCDVHTFTYEDGDASRVWVTGSFTQPAWASEDTGALEMTGSGGSFTATTPRIGPGAHSYKFIVEGQPAWIPDPANGHTEPDGFGGQNSVITLCGGVD